MTPPYTLEELTGAGTVGNAHNSPSYGYTQRALELSSQEAKAQDNAMSYLQKSLNSSSEITTGQGIAAALLAAIPIVGGGLIGRSVGQTKVPDGLYDYGKLAPTGANVGGTMGVNAGLAASQGYLGGVKADNIATGKTYEKMSALEQQRAERLHQEGSSAEMAGLGIDSKIAMMPMEEASQMRVQNASSANSLANSMRLDDYRKANDMIPEDLRAFAKANGVEIPANVTASQLNSVTAAKEAMRRKEGQDTRLGGEAVIPPSVNTKKRLEAALLTKSVGGSYISRLEETAKQDPSYLERNISKTLPSTDLGALQKDLGLYAVTVRNSYEAGVMTEPDFQRYNSYLTIGPLDTVGSVLGRMKELQRVTDLGVKAVLTGAKAGQENVSGYEKLFGFEAPVTLTPIGGQKTKQQFLDEALARRGLKK